MNKLSFPNIQEWLVNPIDSKAFFFQLQFVYTHDQHSVCVMLLLV